MATFSEPRVQRLKFAYDKVIPYEQAFFAPAASSTFSHLFLGKPPSLMIYVEASLAFRGQGLTGSVFVQWSRINWFSSH